MIKRVFFCFLQDDEETHIKDITLTAVEENIHILDNFQLKCFAIKIRRSTESVVRRAQAAFGAFRSRESLETT